MKCHLCHEEAVDTCRSCSHPYCVRHTGSPHDGRGYCAACTQATSSRHPPAVPDGEKDQGPAPVVVIPPGGIKPGIFMNDLTQLMTDEDAALVRQHLPWHQRSGPGLLPVGLIGCLVGLAFGWKVLGTI